MAVHHLWPSVRHTDEVTELDDDSPATSRRLPESTRVEAFSDGVFAIAVTLLVLDLHSPSGERGQFLHELMRQWPSYVAYLAAFLNISAIWISHHDLFTRIHRVDARLICANLLLLMVSSLFPWPASVIAEAIRDGNHSDQVVATVLFATVGLLVPLVWLVLYRCLQRSPYLLRAGEDVSFTRVASKQALVSVIVYPIAAALAFVAPVASLVAFVALPLFFIGTVFASQAPTPMQAATRP
jgi:uncharacterized membrane protein